MDEIRSLADVRPGDIMLGPIDGLGGIIVSMGQALLREQFTVGDLDIRHAGIVTEASGWAPMDDHPAGQITKPKLAQAMARGAEEVGMMVHSHWTRRHAYVRPPYRDQDQALEVAFHAREMVRRKVPYSPLSYLALAGWRAGLATPKLEAWINRRDADGYPLEAICSVFDDQALTMAGFPVMIGVPHQCVTPGAFARRLAFGRWNGRGALWGGPAWLDVTSQRNWTS